MVKDGELPHFPKRRYGNPLFVAWENMIEVSDPKTRWFHHDTNMTRLVCSNVAFMTWLYPNEAWTHKSGMPLSKCWISYNKIGWNHGEFRKKSSVNSWICVLSCFGPAHVIKMHVCSKHQQLVKKICNDRYGNASDRAGSSLFLVYFLQCGRLRNLEVDLYETEGDIFRTRASWPTRDTAGLNLEWW